MRAAQFGGGEREGGGHHEDGMECVLCGWYYALVHVDGQLRCAVTKHCERRQQRPLADVPRAAKPQRQPKQPWQIG